MEEPGSPVANVVNRCCECAQSIEGNPGKVMSYLDNYQTLDTRLSGRRKNDQFFMNLVDAMNVGVVVTDSERKIIFSNKNFRSMTGHSDHNGIGQDLVDSFDDVNSQILKNTYQECLKAAKSSAELRWRHPSGKQINVSISLTASGTESPQNRLIFVVLTDITEHKNAQKAIVHSENKYKVVVENSLTGLFIEQNGKIIFANQRFAKMLGFEMDQLIGMETQSFFRSAYPDFTKEIQTYRKDGQSIWIKLKSRRITYRRKPAILCNVIEISREKLMENRLLDLERKLGDLSVRMLVDQENQKKKIAMELHNGIGKSLTATKSLIEKLIKTHSVSSNVTGPLNKIAAHLQNASDEARRITTKLHPTLLDELGLKATVIWHCQQYQHLHPSINVSLIVNIDESLLMESLKTAIYMLIQEALNDIAEHFGVTQVKIQLFSSAGTLNLVIKDNGVSLSLNTDDSDRAYRFGPGQGGMNEQVRQTGGRFAIGMNHEDQGKYLCFSWPFDPSSQG